PCGEQPLLPMEACNLGSINLSKFIVLTNGAAAIDYQDLGETVTAAVRFLDNTIDQSKYPLDDIDLMVKGNRKIGLGVMGFADLLFQLKIPYNSEEALTKAEEVMKFVQDTSHQASSDLAKERDVFRNFNKSVFKRRKKCRYRNATTTTIAPTGTLSIIGDCSSGVEPLFALSFVRNVMDNDKLLEVNPHFEKVARENGFYNDEIMDQIANEGSLAHVETIPEDVKKVFVTAHDISPEWHIRMQAAFQKYTDNAVSKTVNLPREATVEDVRKIYDLAYELDCKGVTIYRDGSKENQVLSFADKKQGPEFNTGVIDRPETLEGFTTKIKTGLGQLYVTVTEYNNHPFEVFATIGKSGRSTTAKTEAIGRLISLAFRSGVKVDKVVDQLTGIGGEHPVFQEGGLILSIPDAIAKVLQRRYLNDKSPKGSNVGGGLMGEECPECGQTISFEEGCMTCHFCGFTKCG
ncbi:MAG: ribonucleotide-diphosphate reductase subunit alpha, partial [Deltaproteobacteria bacterium]|nr:ribonucleotide-diphosphate reductase subunit alpha [Deltaproteobacteria bacterium]